MKYILGPLTNEQKELVGEALGELHHAARQDEGLQQTQDDIDALPDWTEVADDFTV